MSKKTKTVARNPSLESWIWDAACSIRGAKDAPKYKDYILPLIFTKRLCDVFDDELNRIAQEHGVSSRIVEAVVEVNASQTMTALALRFARRFRFG